MLDITVEEQDAGAAVVRPAGRVDFLTAPELRLCLAELLARRRRRLVVDLRAVDFLDSSGLGALLAAAKAARALGGDLRLARPPEQVRYVLEHTALDRVLPPYAAVEDALADS